MKKLIKKIKKEVQKHPAVWQLTKLLENTYLFYSVCLIRGDKEQAQKIVKILNELHIEMCKTLETSTYKLNTLVQKEHTKTKFLDKALNDLNWQIIQGEGDEN